LSTLLSLLFLCTAVTSTPKAWIAVSIGHEITRPGLLRAEVVKPTLEVGDLLLQVGNLLDEWANTRFARTGSTHFTAPPHVR